MTWLLIDGNNWFAQCHLANGGATNGDAPINFIRRLNNVIEQIGNERAVVCWDDGRSFRHNLSKSYKAGRPEKSPEYHSQLKMTRRLSIETDVCEVAFREGYEADDVIGALSREAQASGCRAIMFSADHDLHQLLVDGIITQVTGLKMTDNGRYSFNTVNTGRLLVRYGLRPDQWVDFRALTGDSSDSINGCPMIGEKTACKILRECDTLEAFYKSPSSVNLPSRRLNSLLSFQERLPEVRRLLTIAVDCHPEVI